MTGTRSPLWEGRKGWGGGQQAGSGSYPPPPPPAAKPWDGVTGREQRLGGVTRGVKLEDAALCHLFSKTTSSSFLSL